MADIGQGKGNSALLLALAEGATVREAAIRARIGERTATRRLADPEFRRRVAELRGEMVGRALGKLADAMTAAAETLRDLLDSGPATARLGAARSILEFGAKLREATEIEDRLRALEERACQTLPAGSKSLNGARH